MNFFSLMKFNKLEGKTIREIEEEHLNGGESYGVLFTFGAGAILLLLVFFIGWQINSKIANLRVENKNLVAENTVLKEEVNQLNNQLASIRMTENLPEPETKPEVSAQNEYFFYEIKPRDTLGDISNEYYGVPTYAPELAKLNGLSVNSTLRVGQIIKVPIKPDKLKS